MFVPNTQVITENNFLAINLCLLVSVVFGILYFLGKRKDQSTKYPKDVVIVHQFRRGPRAPSISPFALKLETWLRMSGIEYQNDFTMVGRSAKGKIPWITYNGIDVSDSQLSMEFLMEKLNINLSSHLTPYEKSLARAFLKLNEESMRWVGVIHRFRYQTADVVGIPYIPFKLVGRKMLKETEAQGYGKHSKEEIYQIGKTDLEALKNFIGDKKFMMGDKVINEDASIFALLCQVIHHDRGPFNKYLMTECPNLIRYVDNMKSLYWPDWNENIREKTK